MDRYKKGPHHANELAIVRYSLVSARRHRRRFHRRNGLVRPLINRHRPLSKQLLNRRALGKPHRPPDRRLNFEAMLDSEQLHDGSVDILNRDGPL
jgi:hypothetical protein